MAISRGQLVKELEPGLNALFGLEYKRYENQHAEIYVTETSDRAFEEEVMLSGFANASDTVAFVADDPYERFEIQSNNTLASAQTDVFMNYDIEVTAGDSANYVSKSELNDSTLTTGTAQIKVIGVSKDIDNNDLGTSNVNFVVMINEHLYNAKNNGI